MGDARSTQQNFTQIQQGLPVPFRQFFAKQDALADVGELGFDGLSKGGFKLRQRFEWKVIKEAFVGGDEEGDLLADGEGMVLGLSEDSSNATATGKDLLGGVIQASAEASKGFEFLELGVN